MTVYLTLILLLIYFQILETMGIFGVRIKFFHRHSTHRLIYIGLFCHITEMTESDFTLVGAGDAILVRKLRTIESSDFDAVVERIRDADAAVVNFESLAHDYEHPPAAASGGTYMRSPPSVLDELTWAGFNLFAAATNHSFDYTHEGLLTTMEHMENRGIAYAGIGRNLAAAREPVYIDTPAGRVALIASCSTITGGSIAGQQRQDMGGRPGIAPIRHDSRYVVPEEACDHLRSLSESLGLEELKQIGQNSSYPFAYPNPDEEGFVLPNLDGEDIRFVPGQEARIERTANEQDIKALLKQVERATRQADWVIASHHSHEYADPTDRSYCAEFVEKYARRCIDQGAHAFIGHGAHVLQGVEIYNQRPIFYDLGNFVFQSQLVSRLPDELYERYGVDPGGNPADLFDARAYTDDGERKGFLDNEMEWLSVLPMCEFDDGELQKITLYPLDLKIDRPRPQRGRPFIPTGDKAEQVIEHLDTISEPYDTSIEYRDGIGRIEF